MGTGWGDDPIQGLPGNVWFSIIQDRVIMAVPYCRFVV
jgi:hypothetical protein